MGLSYDAPEQGGFSANASAESWLMVHFPLFFLVTLHLPSLIPYDIYAKVVAAMQRVRQLAQKGQEGTITEAEKEECIQVGNQAVDLMRSFFPAWARENENW